MSLTRIECIVRNISSVLFLVFILVFGKDGALSSPEDVEEIISRNQLPTYLMEKELQLFYLEGPFPFNTPNDIMTKAGSLFENFGLTQAALGFREVGSYEMFSLQAYAKRFTGGFFPEIRSNLSLNWHNEVLIGYQEGAFSSAGWSKALFLTQISGALFNQYADWLGTYVHSKQTIQPINVCSNSSLPESCLVTAVNSYTFVWDSFQVMSKLGAHIKRDAPMVLEQSRIIYISADDTKQTVVSETAEVIAYYTELKTCLRVAFFFSETLPDFALKAKTCFPNKAYVHLGNNTYLPVKLNDPKVLIERQKRALPDDSPIDTSGVGSSDVIAFVFFVSLFVIGFVLTYFHLKNNKYFLLRGRFFSSVMDESDVEDHLKSPLRQKLLSKHDSHVQILSLNRDESKCSEKKQRDYLVREHSLTETDSYVKLLSLTQEDSESSVA